MGRMYSPADMGASEPAILALPTLLKLERVSISGFKSFCDPVDLAVPEGITAIVGPNGCGKSNIGDAISWVLGEQSPKQLRGSSMQDVIFNGSEVRKPTGLAEVSLCFRSLQGGGAGDGQVVIARRLFRDGESEYLLNGARSRLKDIQELLREARVGTQTYATIEQGRIEQILNARPKDRRLLVEEAAGVAGFKHKRRLAELKLEATQANLLRVGDVLVEVTRQIHAVRRQAARARRYQRLRDELRDRQRRLFGLRARDLDALLAELHRVEASSRDGEVAAAAQVAALDAALVAGRVALDELAARARDEREALHHLELEGDRKETRVHALRERIGEAEEALGRLRAETDVLDERRRGVEVELGRRRAEEGKGARELEEVEASLAAETERLVETSRALAGRREGAESLRRGLFESTARCAELRNRRHFLEETLLRLSAQRQRLDGESVEVGGHREAAEEEWRRLAEEAAAATRDHEGIQAALVDMGRALQEARQTHASDLEALALAREQEKSALARLRTLEDVATRFAGVSDGVRVLLAVEGSRRVRNRGVVADYLEASQEVEGVAEAYLQTLLPAVVVEDDGDAVRAAALLHEQGAGRTFLLCRTQPAGARAVGTNPNGNGQVPEELLKDPRILGRLQDRLVLRSSANGAIGDRIGEALLVDTLETALDLHREHPHLDFLSVKGEVVYASGLVAVGGHKGAERGLLAHGRRVQESRGQTVEAGASVAALGARAEKGRREVERLESAFAARREATEQAGRRGMELGLHVERAGEEIGRLGRRLAVLGEEVRELAEETARLDAAHRESEREMGVAEAVHQEAEAALEAELSALRRLEESVREQGESVAQLRVEVAARRQRQAGVVREREREERALSEIDARGEELRAEADGARRRAAEACEELSATERALVHQLEERRQRLEGTARHEESLAAKRAELEKIEADLRDARERLEAAREGLREAEVGRTRSEADRQHLDALCAQELGAPASHVAEELGDVSPEEGLAALEQDIAALRERIEKIGPVNLMALEEFAGLEERHGFLAAQKKDLEDSIESLKESIRRINRASRERFTEAFETIRQHYQETFRVLFGGGRADLVLEEGEDVLESGIEMVAQPPGKRLGSVSLLSGGEKSMAAIALLFAIFRYQPSPFCLLDEVDAALDDVNVGRFTRMLKEYAAQIQFLLITHNQRSMEIADLLYGVTMQEPGVSRVVSLKL